MCILSAVWLSGRPECSVVTAKRIDKPCIALASTDSGAYDELTNVRALQSCLALFGPYALHKVILLACGIVPLNRETTLEKGNIDGFAELLDRHWRLPRRMDGELI